MQFAPGVVVSSILALLVLGYSIWKYKNKQPYSRLKASALFGFFVTSAVVFFGFHPSQFSFGIVFNFVPLFIFIWYFSCYIFIFLGDVKRRNRGWWN